MHIFDLYRRLLMIVCAVYATVRIIQGLHNWQRRLAGEDRYRRVARDYALAVLLSARVRVFWRDLAEIAILLAVLAAVLAAHALVME